MTGTQYDCTYGAMLGALTPVTAIPKVPQTSGIDLKFYRYLEGPEVPA